ncbi:hypothetical protein AMTRI_Chr13g91710 [Amborella trichopoda]
MSILVIFFFFLHCVVRCDSFLPLLSCCSFASFDNFHEYFIPFIHDLFIISAHFFFCTFFKIYAKDKLSSQLFCSIIFVGNYCYYYEELPWADSVVQMSGWTEICFPFVWFYGRNYCVNCILWIRVSVSFPVVNMLSCFLGSKCSMSIARHENKLES